MHSCLTIPTLAIYAHSIIVGVIVEYIESTIILTKTQPLRLMN